MKFGEMLGFTKRFKEIMEWSNGASLIKSVRLESLMSDLEEAYSIPMKNNARFEKSHPQLMELYRTVSDAREL